MNRSNTTDIIPRNPTLSVVSPKQENALAALLSGATVTEAAKLAGVHRCTVHEWLRSDIGFRAQLSSRQRELRSALGVRLMKLCEKATNVVEKALEEGEDSQFAFDLLKGMGLVKPPNLGWDDPELLRHLERQREIAMTAAAQYDNAGQLMGAVELGDESDY